MKYGFIGCGNMGGAIATAMSKTTCDMALTDRSGKGKALAEKLGCAYLEENSNVIASCDRIFLGVKPQMMQGVLEKLRDVLAEKKPLLITMAAGLTMEKIESFAGLRLPVIRIMPNTPVAIGEGLVLYCANDLVDNATLDSFLQDMAPCGRVAQLDEHLMDAGSALSGSGPAYLYVFLEAMADGAVACGIPRAKAMEYAAATMTGAAEMYLATGQHPGALKDAVCSPMGSTIAGIRALEARNFRSAVMECVCATYQRNLELGK